MAQDAATVDRVAAGTHRRAQGKPVALAGGIAAGARRVYFEAVEPQKIATGRARGVHLRTPSLNANDARLELTEVFVEQRR
jgi:hypothetical protein